MTASSYAIVWAVNNGPEYAGRVELQLGSIVLTGTGAQTREARCTLTLADLKDVRLERRTAGRHIGRPSLVLFGGEGRRIDVTSLDGLGALHELTARVSAGRGKAAT